MTEEFYEALSMVKYFWDDKGDVTRWTGWEEFAPVLKEQRPDIYMIVINYIEAKKAMDAAMRNG